MLERGKGEEESEGEGEGVEQKASVWLCKWLTVCLRAFTPKRPDLRLFSDMEAAFSSSESIRLCLHTPPLTIKNGSICSRICFHESWLSFVMLARVRSSSGGAPLIQ